MYCLPILLSHQPSARKRTIHSLITCQSLQTKLALLDSLFYFFGTNSGHRDKQPLRNEKEEHDGTNRTSGVKNTQSYKDAMLRFERILQVWIHVPFFSVFFVRFHSSYPTTSILLLPAGAPDRG